MKIEEWLSNLKYDSEIQMIHKDNIKILDIRGWGSLVRSFPSTEEAAKFQDSVGEFVISAINEKLENDKFKINLWDNIQKRLKNETGS